MDNAIRSPTELITVLTDYQVNHRKLIKKFVKPDLSTFSGDCVIVNFYNSGIQSLQKNDY